MRQQYTVDITLLLASRIIRNLRRRPYCSRSPAAKLCSENECSKEHQPNTTLPTIPSSRSCSYTSPYSPCRRLTASTFTLLSFAPVSRQAHLQRSTSGNCEPLTLKTLRIASRLLLRSQLLHHEGVQLVQLWHSILVARLCQVCHNCCPLLLNRPHLSRTWRRYFTVWYILLLRAHQPS